MQKNPWQCKTILYNGFQQHNVVQKNCLIFNQTGEKNMLAHIYRAPKKTWKLIISRSAEISAEFVVIEYTFHQKRHAKQFAKEYGAKAWNY